MNDLRIDEQSDYDVFLEGTELEPLSGMKDSAVSLRTARYRDGVTIILSRAQVIELRNWLNGFLIRTS